MRIQILFFLTMLFFQEGLSQNYLNEIIPLNLPENTSPNAAEVVLFENDFLITVIYSGVKSTIIRISGQDYQYINIDSFDFAANSLSPVDEGILGFAKNREKQKALLLARYDKYFNEEWITEIQTDGNFNFARSSLIIEKHIYALFSYDILDTRFLGLAKYDIEGNHVWTNCYNKVDHTLNTTGVLRATEDNKILISSSNLDMPIGVYGLITCIDTSGAELWSTGSLFDNYRESILYPVELSDGRIVTSQHKDFWGLPEMQCCDPYTPSLIWLDAQGGFIREQIYRIPRPDEVNISGLVGGKGDYFFSHGNVVDVHPTSFEFNYYGYITKHDNEGDTIWTRRYRHPDYDRHTVNHRIEDIIELEDGDIVAMGEISDFTSKAEIWYLRVDSMGCFLSEQCDDEVLIDVISSMEQATVSPYRLYPNPTSGLLTLENDSGVPVSVIEVFDLAGHTLLRQEDKLHRIDLTSYAVGVYFVRIYSGDRVETIRVVKGE